LRASLANQYVWIQNTDFDRGTESDTGHEAFYVATLIRASEVTAVRRNWESRAWRGVFQLTQNGGGKASYAGWLR
jgi:hypothetical protein